MTEPFRSRRFTPVPAALRPRRHRRAARVVVTDGTSVLLFADTDPGLPGSRWWVTPGGGIDPGEGPLEAAVRELAEETGQIVEPAELVGPVAVREVVHGYSDQILSQHETFYLWFTEVFEVDTAGYTEDELLTIAGSAWLPLAELGAQTQPVWPAGIGDLVALAGQPERWPSDLGFTEESTLPVE